MTRLEEIKKPIQAEMDVFEGKFRESLSSRVALLDRITNFIVKRKGKQMRPMFVFLSARLFSEPDESTFRAASLIEMLHTATLVHDDVVDDANLRRGFFSLNALWKNKIAVLVGDYLLSRCLMMATEHKEFHLLEIVSRAVREISEGELLQIEKARRLDIQEDVYFEIIRQKTASLIAACCQAGTASVNQDPELNKTMYKFGETIGLAFQIKDDLFDYQKSDVIGKPTGIDIKEQKMTLPLIHVLSKASSADKRYIINTVKKHHKNPRKVNKLIDFVVEQGGLDYASNKMHELHAEAREMLLKLPKNEARDSLENLVDYVINRKK